jgi:hypothetical protein
MQLRASGSTAAFRGDSVGWMRSRVTISEVGHGVLRSSDTFRSVAHCGASSRTSAKKRCTTAVCTRAASRPPVVAEKGAEAPEWGGRRPRPVSPSPPGDVIQDRQLGAPVARGPDHLSKVVSRPWTHLDSGRFSVTATPVRHCGERAASAIHCARSVLTWSPLGSSAVLS